MAKRQKTPGLSKPFIPVALLLMSFAGCSKVPSSVVQPEEMALLMADIHTGEAVVEQNRQYYPDDSARQVFRQSIYMKHGITPEQFDSSLSWYGHHITEYMALYDRTIEILENRLSETGNRIAAENAISMAGDSVDVWPGARYITLADRMPSKIMTFSLPADPNWERGDSYTLRAKFFNHQDNSVWGLAADYGDSIAVRRTEYVAATFSGDGWREVAIYSDSTEMPVRVYGYVNISTRGATEVRLDSVELVRKRLNPRTYNQRYRQRSVVLKP
ncbi:MAG: DUF4296 domain-containing protein [Muribaculaceae bacterium]|jgi:hypothetical protein